MYCGQTVGWIKMPLGVEVSLGTGHIVFDGDPAPSKGTQQPHPNFWPVIVAKWLDVSRCHLVRSMRRLGSQRQCVRWGHFFGQAHVYCGQTAGSIKMPLGTEVDLGAGDTVLDGDQLLPKRGHSSPQFLAHAYCRHRCSISATAELLLF